MYLKKIEINNWRSKLLSSFISEILSDLSKFLFLINNLIFNTLFNLRIRCKVFFIRKTSQSKTPPPSTFQTTMMTQAKNWEFQRNKRALSRCSPLSLVSTSTRLKLRISREDCLRRSVIFLTGALAAIDSLIWLRIYKLEKPPRTNSRIKLQFIRIPLLPLENRLILARPNLLHT